jgi:hypothetical protein
MFECSINGLIAEAVIDCDFANDYQDVVAKIDSSACCVDLREIIKAACFSGEYLPMSITKGIEHISFTGLFVFIEGSNDFMVQSAFEIIVTYHGKPVINGDKVDEG